MSHELHPTAPPPPHLVCVLQQVLHVLLLGIRHLYERMQPGLPLTYNSTGINISELGLLQIKLNR